jgi:hypothetical protein
LNGTSENRNTSTFNTESRIAAMMQYVAAHAQKCDVYNGVQIQESFRPWKEKILSLENSRTHLPIEWAAQRQLLGFSAR